MTIEVQSAVLLLGYVYLETNQQDRRKMVVLSTWGLVIIQDIILRLQVVHSLPSFNVGPNNNPPTLLEP